MYNSLFRLKILTLVEGNNDVMRARKLALGVSASLTVSPNSVSGAFLYQMLHKLLPW